MDLKKMLLRDFGIDFPISGGMGNSRSNPIVVHRANPNDYVGVEHGVLQCIAKSRGVSIKVKKQNLVIDNGRSIDRLNVELINELGAEGSEPTIESFFFDVTECLGAETASQAGMDDRSRKIVQFWLLADRSGKIPRGQIAGSVYFGVTNNVPPQDVEGIDSAMGLIEYFKKQETGIGFTQAERTSLGQEIVRMHLTRRTPGKWTLRFLRGTPIIAIVLSMIALMTPPFSWVVLAVTIFGLAHNGFAKYLAGKGHRSTSLHIGIALVALALSVALSLRHIISSYQLL